MINWCLLSDGKIIIDKKNIECEFEINKFIKYIEDDETLNEVDLVNKIYIRENNEFMFKIDFKNNLFSYILKKDNITIKDNIKCEYFKEDKKITLKYQLDEEEKKIIIQIL